MYIAPNSTIKLLTGVPIDKNQSDTLWFASVAAQTAYFNSKVKRTFSAQTYQRVQRGYARIEVSADAIYDCNYMMFQNTSYGNKWFYAFINNVEYINNDVAEIRFTIDPIQTWFFDYTLHQCFIERETPASDEIGENILPEPVATGEFVMNNGDYSVVGLDTRTMAIVVALIDPQHSAKFYGGGVYNGVMSGAKLYVFANTLNGVKAINNLILNNQPVQQAPDALIMMYMCPRAVFGQTDNELEQGYADGFDAETDLPVHIVAQSFVTTNTAYENNITAITKTTPLNGYVPRNKKCYTYPYTFYHIDNGQGQGMALRYEFFENLRPKVRVSCNNTYPVEIVLFPYRYKNSPQAVGTEYQEYRNEKLAIKGFPQCSWSMDAFNAWLAQNSVPMMFDVAGSIASLGATAGIGMAGGDMGTAGLATARSAGGILSNITNIGKEIYKNAIAADITSGSFMSGSNDCGNQRFVFKGGCVTQPVDYLRAIDQFFDAFGYSKRAWGTVNNHTRSRWTYIKTIGANVDGELPADDAKYIADCYDNGIRFWADTVHPCDYTTANGFLS